MSNTKLIVNCKTGEVQELELTAEEIAEREAQAIQAAEEQALRDAELQAQADAKASAEAKLAVLGLSVDEIKALLG